MLLIDSKKATNFVIMYCNPAHINIYIIFSSSISRSAKGKFLVFTKNGAELLVND